MEIFTAMLFVSFICAGFCSWLAAAKGRSRIVWLINGLFFSIIALVALAGAPDERQKTKEG